MGTTACTVGPDVAEISEIVGLFVCVLSSLEVWLSSIGDMTSARDRPRLLLLMGHLLNPNPDGPKFGVRVSRSRTPHLANATTL